MNLIQIAGHLGADPETRFTPNGQKVTTLRVATNSRKNNKDETVWWRVTIWGDRFDRLMPHLKKGSAVIIVGEMSKPEIYTDKEGNAQISLNLTAEMIRFSPFGKGERQNEEQQGHGQQAERNSGYSQEANQSYAYTASAPKNQNSAEEMAYSENDQLPF